MKKIINLTLSIFSPLAAVPTGWAIYAGVTEQPAFPMNPMAAAIGAIAIIATSIAAGMLITDVKAYNQGLKNKTEQADFEMPSIPAWLIFGGCVLAEIVLSLLIVVIPNALVFGVLVFPLMTAAGVFAFAVRYDLQKRETELAQARTDKKKLAQDKPKVARKKNEVAEPLPQPLLKVARKHISDSELLAYLAENAGQSQELTAAYFGVTRQAIGGRIKKLYAVKDQ